MCQDQNKRAISLKNKSAHQNDHKVWSRRGFLQTLGLASGAGLTFGGFSVNALASSNLMPLITNGDSEDRILVMIRLKGGNDGLNTIIPIFDYSNYQAARPNIKIAQNNTTSLTDKYAVPNSMQSIIPLWNNGQMKVINTVGYDNHNLSHFNSSDIWNAANTDIGIDTDKSGWLGRYILDKNPDYLENLPAVPGAIKISSGSNIAFQNADQIDLAVSFNTPDRLLSVAETGFVYDTVNLPDDCYYGEQVGFLRSLLNVTFSYAPQISDAYTAAANAVEYSNNELSRQLSIVARLIKGNLGTKLYMVTLDGFDTHENQIQRHATLMRNLTDAVSEFYQDLATTNQDEKVLSMTFSEFGRRIKENDGGTDHGTAAPIMLFGPALNGNGILGDDPDLSNVDNNGNLNHSVDFRSVYATILEDWLCLDPVGVDSILGAPFDRLAGLGINCISTATDDPTHHTQTVSHSIRPDGMGGMLVEYTLVRPGNVEIAVFSILGQKVAQLASGYQLSGTYQATYINRYAGISTMPLIYRIMADGRQFSGKFVIGGN